MPCDDTDGAGADPGPRRNRAASPPTRLLVLVNRNSRRGAAFDAAMVAPLVEAGIEPIVETCDAPAEVSARIVAAAAEFDGVAIAGGDGTLNSAAAGLVATGLPLGILPFGTANDLANTLGIPEDPAEAARVIARGHTRRIDLGEVNGCYFFNVASVGLAAELTRQLTGERKRRWGRLAYPLTALRALFDMRPFHADVVTPAERTRVLTLQITVGNGRHYGGGMTVAEAAEIDDGQLDLFSLELRSPWLLVRMLADLRRGSHGSWREVRVSRGAGFEIRTRRSRQVSCDGELITTTPARFRVRPAAVTVYAPSP
ncbi:lipid kinase [Blastochloris viridis]|uniref:Diacylglycerol kinase n=2 Tax=Blastochloris viridis TaxID=1079 RepID=A0A0S4Q7F3_BLAVI|nr:lipid kinase [Blastochloris viridis]CUU43842.1 Diacylglycerol kinase [Blastochloris viridis]